MLIFTREKLLARMLETSRLSSLYQANDPSFVTGVLTWVGELERELAALRLPLASLCAAERGRLLACQDGLCESAAQGAPSPRKLVRANAAHCLARIEAALRERVDRIQEQLDADLDKVCQLVTMSPLASSPDSQAADLTHEQLREAWKRLAETSAPEARPLHRYLSARIHSLDREELLRHALENLETTR